MPLDAFVRAEEASIAMNLCATSVVTWVLAASVATAGPAAAEPVVPPASPPPASAPRLPSGVALPYPAERVFRGFGPCIGRGRHRHEAIDLGGVGPDGGLGTPVRSMVKARVVMIGSADARPKDFGTPYRGRRQVLRAGRRYPPNREVPGYGTVRFFSARRGKWRSGNVIATVGLEPPLEGHLIRYMHLGATRPDLAVGDIVEAGAEVGLFGGTGVQRSSPHVHIDIRTPDDRPVDVAPLLGLSPTTRCGEVHERALAQAEAFEDATPIGPPPPAEWPAGPSGDGRPPLSLEPPPPPWRTAASGGVIDTPPIALDVPDCGVATHAADGPRELQTELHAGRWVELELLPAPSSTAPAPGQAPQAPSLELWDRTTRTRLMPGDTEPVTITELAARPGTPARLRLVVGARTRLALVVRASAPWGMTLGERCKPKPPPAP